MPEIEIEASSAWVWPRRQRQQRVPAVKAACMQCGAPNPPPGTRSTSIDALDEVGLFCTLRCAARYGVSIARGRFVART